VMGCKFYTTGFTNKCKYFGNDAR